MKTSVEQTMASTWIDFHSPDLPMLGTYACGHCHQPLFHSRSCFGVGSDNAYFRKPLRLAMSIRPDFSAGPVITQVRCTQCRELLGRLTKDITAPGESHPEGNLHFSIRRSAINFVPETQSFREAG